MQEKTAEDKSDIVGKKVFLLYPHSVIQNDLISTLIHNEYEVYLLKDHEKALKLFAYYPDCIVFINIDDHLSEPEWELYIRTMMADKKTKDVKIGILTYDNTPDLAEKYLMEIMVPCGFIRLSLGLKASTEILLKVLEANEAKGRRRFLRAFCAEGSGSFNFKVGNSSFSGHIVNVSSVGIAAYFDDRATFASKTLLQDVQLRLKGVLCKMNLIIMGTRTQEDGRFVYILLFTPDMSLDSREKIRTFIQQTLQSEIEIKLKHIENGKNK